MGNILLECKSLKKYFGTPRGALHAVDDVSFAIEEGRTLGVVGESGCGKSTLGRTILRLLPATDGEVVFRGENILNYGGSRMAELRRSMQIIFQDPFSSLDPRKTIYQTISEPLKIHKLCVNEAELKAKTYELMALVGLAERYAGSYPHELDGGRRQRIGIARALSLNPGFIVCDEPVSALDVSIQAQILNLMMDLQDELKLTYLFITHDLSVVKHISDDILVMYLGQVVEYAPSDELFEKPAHPYTQALLKSIPIPEIGQGEQTTEFLRGELSSPIEPSPGCRFLPRCPSAQKVCGERDPALREISSGHRAACFAL